MTNPAHQAQAAQPRAMINALFTTNPHAPDRIWGWQNSQLSIARHYGGCDYNGHRYVIDKTTEGQPLVRLDVITRENKAKVQAAMLARSPARAEVGQTQKEIF